MMFKTRDQIMLPDPRFATLCVVRDGFSGYMKIGDHYDAIAAIALTGSPPAEVRMAFDRARNVMLYSWFTYELLIVAEVQALSAFELALAHRLAAHPVKGWQSMRNLVDRARRFGILPPLDAPIGLMDPIEALVALRNALSHGTADTHSPAMAADVLEACAREIAALFPA
jgi:hypothetical protein